MGAKMTIPDICHGHGEANEPVIGCVQHDCEKCQQLFRVVVDGEDLSFPLLRLLAAALILFVLGYIS